MQGIVGWRHEDNILHVVAFMASHPEMCISGHGLVTDPSYYKKVKRGSNFKVQGE